MRLIHRHRSGKTGRQNKLHSPSGNADRKLGDQWKFWKETGNRSEKDSRTGKRVYLAVFLGIIALEGVLLFFLWYMISPRLSQWAPLLSPLVGMLCILVWAVSLCWFAALVCTIASKIPGLDRTARHWMVRIPSSLVMKIGSTLGIPKDRLGHSFVKISNIIFERSLQKIKPENLLILLPRCLQPALLRKIRLFSNTAHIPVHTVSGGEKAREIIGRIRPRGVIGVACERDLFSGIQDVTRRIPVIGIPNLRPEGPCKNTTICWGDFKRAVCSFLGSDFDPSVFQILEE